MHTVTTKSQKINNTLAMETLTKIVCLIIATMVSLTTSSPVPPIVRVNRWVDPCGGSNIADTNTATSSVTTATPPSTITLPEDTRTKLNSQIQLLTSALEAHKQRIVQERVQSDGVRNHLETLSIDGFPIIKDEEEAVEDGVQNKLDTFIKDYGQMSRLAMFVDLMKKEETDDVMASKIEDVNERLYALLCTLKTIIDNNSGSLTHEDAADVIPSKFLGIVNNAIRHYRDYLVVFKAIGYTTSIEIQYGVLDQL